MKTAYLSSACFGTSKIYEHSLIQVSVGLYTKTQYLNKILLTWSSVLGFLDVFMYLGGYIERLEYYTYK